MDLRGLRITSGIDFEFEELTPINELAPGESLVLVSNQEAFAFRYGTAWNIAGVFENSTHLNNGGERITAVNAAGQTVLDVTYSDQAPWPESSDGRGSYLALINPNGEQDPNLASSWQAMPESGLRPSTGAAALYQQWLAVFFAA